MITAMLIKLIQSILLALILGAPVGAARVDIPHDGGKYHLSLIGTQGEDFAELTQAFLEGNAALVSLREQCHFHWILTTEPIAQNYTNSGATPIVRLQDHRGRVLYESVGPIRVETLARQIWQSCPDGQCLRRRRVEPYPEPKPDPPKPPEPTPAPVYRPPVIIDQRPAPMPVADTVPPWWLLGVLAAGGAATMLVIQMRRNP